MRFGYKVGHCNFVWDTSGEKNKFREAWRCDVPGNLDIEGLKTLKVKIRTTIATPMLTNVSINLFCGVDKPNFSTS